MLNLPSSAFTATSKTTSTSAFTGTSATSKSKGFTLLEVMIALIIFSLVATVIQKVTSQTISQYERIRLKTIANWIAENKMAEVRLSGDLPPAKESKEDIEFAKDHWKLVSKVSKTPNANFNRVDLVIFHKDSDDQFDEGSQILTYSGFVGLH
ncbi:type II secretion system minor pseudopilin GspI [Alkalimarinus alittae]|uniref:Type II secretion system protein I n=1 Tax=Alkalimarinus alittae TaxID=2961619 RepID=A0ABY6MXC3_9ALTE|nr:type II secretion system minor pseudopilin GspI [Alkalimarinus alittae]UZE94476.1 type II secretion system minor pseudopilin GspI [Alkalimarinus alittae]